MKTRRSVQPAFAHDKSDKVTSAKVTPESCLALMGAATYPLIVIHNAAPVQHVHHGLEAEDGLLVELVVTRHREGSGCHHDRLVSLYPCKLLLPNLCTTTV